jgi:serine/threonine protein kinase
LAQSHPTEIVSAREDAGARSGSALVPDAFGPFQVLEHIGAGLLGPVYSALQLEIDCLVAVKHFTLGLRIDRARRVLTQFDALLTTPLDHLSIASSIGSGITDGAPYLIQELARGTSLAQLAGQGRTLSVPDVVRLTKQAADALDFAAQAGIDHGGLKPTDIIVSGANARVTGFGVHRALERAGVNAPAPPPYAAPERISGAIWDHRSDTFSLAAIAFELLFGDAVAMRDDGLGVDVARALEHAGPLAQVDAGILRELFEQALSPDVDDRFENATAFATALQDVCAAPADAPGPFRRRRPFAVIARPVAPEPRAEVAEIIAPIDSTWASASAEASAADVLPDLLAQIESAILAAPVAEAQDVEPEVPPVPAKVVEEAVAVRVRPRRRYSIFWPLIFGPIAGVVIGLILALMYVTHAPRPLSPHEGLVKDRQKRAQPPPPVDENGPHPVYQRASL